MLSPTGAPVASQQLIRDFDAFRVDFITYLSQKLELPAEFVTHQLGEWLLDSAQHHGPSHDSQVPPRPSV